MRAKKANRAIRCFDKVIDIDLRRGCMCQKGRSFGLLGWLEEQLSVSRGAIDINSHHASSWLQIRASLSVKLKHDNEAVMH